MTVKGRRKQRIKERDEKRKGRGSRSKYQGMAERGMLGEKELQNYNLMYSVLNKEQTVDFKNPNADPTREDYNKLKRFYYTHLSSLEYRTQDEASL